MQTLEKILNLLSKYVPPIAALYFSLWFLALFLTPFYYWGGKYEEIKNNKW